MYQCIMKRSILSNISFNFIIKVITYLFSFLTLMYVARVLQPDAYGRASFSASVAGYFSMLAKLGMPTYAMRSCAENRSERKRLSNIFNELWSISIVLSVISIILFAGTVILVPKFRDNTILMLIYGSSIIFQMLGCEWLYRGLEKLKFLAVTTFICKLVSFVCILLFVHSAEQINMYAFLSVLTGCGSNIFCFLMLKKHVDVSFRIRINTAHFKPIFIFFLMSCAVYVYGSLDLTMLGFMKSDYETGLYNLASKGKSVLAMIGGLVWSSILPVATNLWKNGDRKRFESLAAKSLAGVTAVQFAATVFCLIFARPIILLVGGESYLGSVTAFRILVLSLVPIGISNILGGQVLIPAEKERRLLVAEAYGAVFNFIANLILIPFLSIVGAALTTTVSEIIVLIICIYYVRKDLDMDPCAMAVRKVFEKLEKRLRLFKIRLRSRILRERLPKYCPCCDTYLRKFIKGGYDMRPDRYNPDRYAGMDQDVICPICHSLPRHRILALWMEEHIDDIKDRRILYFAREGSIHMWMDRNHIECTTADLFNPADLKLDIEDTGLKDASYDVIICNHVLEHVDDFRVALKEMYRILRPGGSLIISFPMDSKIELLDEDAGIVIAEERWLRFGQSDHKRVFGMKADIFLSEAGFTVERICGDDYPKKILPVVGPADYDMNVLFRCVR